MRRDGEGGKVVWCTLALPDDTEVAASAAQAPADQAAGRGWHRQLPSATRPGPAVRSSHPSSTPERSLELGDRDQLAARLLAELIQPLFGLGLQLQEIGGLTEEAEVRRRLDGAIEDLDTMISDLRAGLFTPTASEVRRLPGTAAGDQSPIGTGE